MYIYIITHMILVYSTQLRLVRELCSELWMFLLSFAVQLPAVLGGTEGGDRATWTCVELETLTTD